MFRRGLIIPLLAIGSPLLVVAILLLMSRDRDRESALLEAGYGAILQERFRDAEGLALAILGAQPESAAGLALAAQAAAGAGEQSRVEEYVTRLVGCSLRADPRVEEQLVRLAGTLIDNGQFAKGERVLRFLVSQAPLNVKGRKNLAQLLAMTGRRREAREQTMAVFLREPVTVDELVMAADDFSVFEDRAITVRQASVRVPDDPIACLGVAWTEYQSDHPQEAEMMCREALKCDPDLLDAHALMGNILLDRGDFQGLRVWQSKLPASADQHDEIWAVRGLWLRDEGQNESAARCFWEAIRRNPEHRVANLELGKLLTQLGRADAAEAFLHRGDYLRQLRLQMEAFDSDELRKPSDGVVSIAKTTPPATTDAMEEIAEVLEELRRDEEALAWAAAAQELAPDLVWPPVMMQRLAQAHQTFTASLANPALRFDLSDLELSQEFASTNSAAPGAPQAVGESHVQFTDDTVAAGIHFTYFNSPHTGTDKSWPFEWPGGGSGVLDYDLDGWPDIYLPQGCPMMPYDEGHQYRDVLYRNQASGGFQDVSAVAGLGDRNFSHGCAVGDYDNDGFPDLYVCNLGQSRLIHNNGDGTFQDVTEAAGIHCDTWSVCAAIVDLNRDGLPEIYEVNHMSKESVFAEVCKRGGKYVACQQGLKFQPEEDRLFGNRGDGTFADITQESGVVAPLGFGLGIVAADFSNRGQIDVFVANDGYANFYFVNQTQQPGDPVKLVENAVTSGVAFDPNGAPQACMGVAAADADRNGLIDLFITNYYNEPNAFYRQTGAEFFVDNTRSAGLYEPSYALLGFGTQFLDGELDGLRDLIITNGDVEDFSDVDRPYRQRPQYFKNLGGAKFSEIPRQALGPFFEGEYLGRGLSRLDWNRDGLEECIVSHLDSPTVLLTNRTRNAGNFLAVELRGVKSARDAVGANVTVRCSDEWWIQSVTAGDGYMASNERQLFFGLGKYEKVDSLSIRWPSGQTDEFTNLAIGNEIICVEGRTQYVTLSR